METRSSLRLLFYIKRTKLLKKDGKAPLFLKITVNKSSTEFSLHRSINPDIWNSVNGTADGRSKEADTINKFIDSVKYKIYDSVNTLNASKSEITSMSLKKMYLGIKDPQLTIINQFYAHNKYIETLKNNGFAPGTINHYNTTLNHLKKFLASKCSKNDITIHEVNFELIRNFELYLKTDCSCSHNTAMKHLSRLKKVTNIELKKGNLTKDPFADFSLRSHKTIRDYLNQHELSKIIEKKFSIQRIEQVKDCFLFSCFTGLAYNEIKNLKKENIILGIDGKKWISIIRQKSKENNLCKVPILPLAQKILDKYSDHPTTKTTGLLLPVPSNQKMNSYLKEVGDLCGITKNLTSHIARHTFATTVTLNNGVPMESVSKMLGHSDLKTTKIYAKLLDNRISDDMQKVAGKY